MVDQKNLYSRVISDPKFSRIKKQNKRQNRDERFLKFQNHPDFRRSEKIDIRTGRVKKNKTAFGEEYEDHEIENQSLWDDEISDEDLEGNEAFSSIRGHERNGSFDTDNSDQESFDDDTEIIFPQVGPWTEENEEEVEVNENVSSRLAVCNMDFEKIEASDLYVMMSAVLPETSHINSVRVYVSEYGKEKLAQEKITGPIDAMGKKESFGERITDSADGPEDTPQNEYQNEKLRAYELSRFKYYFAVVDCDSVETSQILYRECDGVEIENSAFLLDLRYIPDEIQFDDNDIISECCSNPEEYTNVQLFNRALHHSKVELTWDKTDPRRLAYTTKFNFTEEDCGDESKCHQFVATPSASEGEGEDHESKKNSVDSVQKYKKLLEDLDQTDSRTGEELPDERMEVTWTSGLEKVTMSFSSSEGEESENDDEEKHEKSDAVRNLHDPLLCAPAARRRVRAERKKKRLMKIKSLRETTEHNVSHGDTQEAARMEILSMPRMEDCEESQSKHFNYRKIMADAQDKKAGKKTSKRKIEDDFDVDLTDSRFSAVFHSADYAIDPSDANYKSTSANEKILAERVRRREMALDNMSASNLQAAKRKN